jgi:hypothetical protein
MMDVHHNGDGAVTTDGVAPPGHVGTEDQASEIEMSGGGQRIRCDRTIDEFLVPTTCFDPFGLEPVESHQCLDVVLGDRFECFCDLSGKRVAHRGPSFQILGPTIVTFVRHDNKHRPVSKKPVATALTVRTTSPW